MKRVWMSAAAVLLMLALSAALVTPAWAEGCAPVAQNLELKTYRNTSVGGTLSAYDPDGDVTGYEITTQPIKGTLKLEEDGSFVYTPRPNKKGRDYFGYKAVDAAGNRSQEATAIIRIEKDRGGVHYEDMSGRAGEFAAVELSKAGLFTGETLGGRAYFGPDRGVTRGEFLQLCALACNSPVLDGVFSSGYTDDETMSDWTKALAATAAMEGTSPRGGAFEGEALIGLHEAARMLERALGLGEATAESEAEEGLRACMSLAAAGVLDAKETGDRVLTRETAAMMLVKAMALMEN